MAETLTALGMMSGTSMDGVDAAIIHTDGAHITLTHHSLTQPFSSGLREQLHTLVKSQERTPEAIAAAEKALTEAHAEAVQALLQQAELQPADIDVIGFHGQTILHQPEQQHTWQIGDAALLAEQTGISVVSDFRSADMQAGGQGAPLAPLFHAALARDLPKPVAFVNIGGVANITYISATEENTLACDVGPGNALLDDWVNLHLQQAYDKEGALAAAGTPDESLLQQWLQHPYFAAPPPKSLDRNEFHAALEQLTAHSTEDGAATLTAFIALCIKESAHFLPEAPHSWYICGGGRHNPTLMRSLADMLTSQVQPVEALDLNGDIIEAQAFAYLAVRSLKKLPLTLPSTTGVLHPVTGGVFCPA